ncbi:peptidylprolyl isomerase [Exilibacterium tricleocarpae]|uniref:Periplasmic chaperone PpiD n=1 Tax=Exilibacterium tricleocarpae TaxID=2591008 RepID=A0A545T8C5_9GAMM|nr:SurA N-terminal domain-containing protein [Exilibacterium tricleocarpae]TQV73448.1 peptidylprolyl isomerase [Exilibacterium tricleocarpae]
MLQSLRDNLKGTAATIIVVFIALSFGLVGLETLFAPSVSGSEAASVNGEAVTETELARAIQFQKRRLEAQFGDQMPAGMVSDERLREPVLNDLIQRLVLVQEAMDRGMAVSDQRLDDIIINTEQFHDNGQFSPEIFTQLLRMQGYTPAGYKRLLAQDVLLNQHVQGVNDSGFATEDDLRRIAALSMQTRSFQYLTVPIADTEAGIELTDEEIQAYYEEHTAEYQSPEQVAVEYIDLSPAVLTDAIDVAEEDVRQQYEQELAERQDQTRRRAAHILLEPKDDGSDQSLLADLQARLAKGEDFAELAREYSDDLGSKDQGGDLGYTSGDAFPEAFEAALAEMAEGEVSAPVETDAGWHLIKLIDIEESQAPSFEQDRGRIENVLRLAQAEELFVELAERLADLAYNADNLGEVAETLGIEARTSALFSRSGGVGLLANRDVIDAAFSDDVLVAGNTSDMLELSESRVVVLRVTEHQKARTKTLEEVRDLVTSSLRRDKAKTLLAEAGEALQQRLRDGEALEEVAKSEGYESQTSLEARRTEPGANRQVLQHVFTLPKPADDDTPVISTMNLANGDYVLVSLTAVASGDFEALAKEQRTGMSSQLADQYSNMDFAAYEDFLKKQSDIDIK